MGCKLITWFLTSVIAMASTARHSCWPEELGISFVSCCMQGGVKECWDDIYTYDACCLSGAVLSAFDLAAAKSPLDCGCNERHDGRFWCLFRDALSAYENITADYYPTFKTLSVTSLAECPLGTLAMLTYDAVLAGEQRNINLMSMPSFVWTREWLRRSGRSLFEIAESPWRIFRFLSLVKRLSERQDHKVYQGGKSIIMLDPEPHIACGDPKYVQGVTEVIRGFLSGGERTRRLFGEFTLTHPGFIPSSAPKECQMANIALSLLTIVAIRWQSPARGRAEARRLDLEASTRAAARVRVYKLDILGWIYSRWPIFDLLEALHYYPLEDKAIPAPSDQIFLNLPPMTCQWDFVAEFRRNHTATLNRGFTRYQKAAHHHLPRIANALRAADMPPILNGGLLLGYIRQCSAISHDDDIDFVLPRKFIRLKRDYERLERTLADYGYAVQHNLDTFEDRGWVIRSLVPEEVFWIDLFILDEDPRTEGCTSPICGWTWYLHNHEYYPTQRKQCVGYAFNFRLAAWLNTTFWVPNDPMVYLADYYGRKWRVPQSSSHFRTCHDGKRDETILEKDKKGYFFNKLLLPLGKDVVDLQMRVEHRYADLIADAWTREWETVHAVAWTKEWEMIDEWDTTQWQ
eukprot:GEMP01025432.1.p1 GENE.GEMP01025432.1~~GEMP01025432.1.p1  ORF type:complete len:631 (+),score=129.69 GEMP01025432.1:87-1979(+)